MSRWLELEGAANARDVGGLPTAGGGQVRRGVLLRSDNLQDLSPRDIRLLTEDLGLDTVVDLRTPAEVAAEGPGPLVAAGVRHVYLDLIPGWDPRRADVGRVVPHEQREAGDVSHHYLAYLTQAADAVVLALRAVTHASGAALVHCAAGKDRTGVVVALALSVAEVPAEAVVADYELSAQRIAAVRDRLAASPTYAADMQRRTLADMTPHAQSMRHFLDRMAELGGVPAWLAEQGFAADEQARLRRRLTT